MIANPGLVPRPISPEELAAALRGGLEVRRMLPEAGDRPAPPASHPEPPFQSLWPLSGLLGHPVPPTPGRVRQGIRLVRRLVRKLMAPWLDFQTRFNHALLAELQALDLPARDRALQDAVHQIQVLQERLNECHFKLETALARPPAPAPAAPRAEAAESVFVQTRMPEPPGHALVLSGGAAAVGVLRDIGYTVLHAAAAEMHDLPLRPGAFRVILALGSGEGDRPPLWSAGGSAARAAVARLLSPNGRVFGSARAASPEVVDAVARVAAPLRVVAHAVAAGVAVWAAES